MAIAASRTRHDVLSETPTARSILPNRSATDAISDLFGAQMQGTFALSPKTTLTLSVANLYFANTSAINPIQVFGSESATARQRSRFRQTARLRRRPFRRSSIFRANFWFPATEISDSRRQRTTPSTATDGLRRALIWLI